MRRRLAGLGMLVLIAAALLIAREVRPATNRPAQRPPAPTCITFEITARDGRVRSACLTDAELGEQVRRGRLGLVAQTPDVAAIVDDIVERRRLGH